MRLFFATWPGAETQEQLIKIRDSVNNVKTRPVPRENLHLTVVFIGKVDAQHVSSIRRAAHDIKCRPCELLLEEFFRWNKSLTLAAKSTPAELLSLRQSLLELVAPYVPKPLPEQGFHPHVTLLRRVRTMPKLPLAPKLRFAVTGFSLVRSDLDDVGAHYQTIESYPAG